MLIFVGFASQFLIVYSSQVQSFWIRRVYNKESFEIKDDIFSKFSVKKKDFLGVLYLMFFGPLIMVLIHIANFVKAIILLFCCMFGLSEFFTKVENWFLNPRNYLLGIDPELTEKLALQRSMI